MHEIYTEKRRLSTTYPHGFPHSVENYMGVIHPQAVDNVVDNVVDKWWIAVDEQAKARKRPTSAYGRSAFLIRIKDNLTIEKTIYR